MSEQKTRKLAAALARAFNGCEIRVNEDDETVLKWYGEATLPIAEAIIEAIVPPRMVLPLADLDDALLRPGPLMLLPDPVGRWLVKAKHRLVGPFATQTEASEWAQRNLKGSWRVVEMEQPS